ncbi:F0F1 ATP synthase subunit A [Desulfogranum japonicum]|uniref:F0F1 ATP synthase subunit A n=1 Tax=Desulfogranum japonicum TaxID=231447 RepID=UPI00041A04AD|nr:F0F1 ATP synthase subunit A [Desulfogranum japonicum]
MSEMSLTSELIFQIGPLEVTGTVVTTWALMAGIWLFALLVMRRLRLSPGPVQTAIEGIVIAIEEAVEAVAPQHFRRIMPFVGTIWIFLIIANLAGLIPTVHSPTRDLSATAALAFVVFLSTHWFGIRIQGLKAYLRHYLSPTPVLLPFHIISEITRTIALAVRLFGNIMSLELTALLILMVAGFLAPVPILMLHIVEALVQAYIFGMLALIYIAGGIQSLQLRQQTRSSQ